MPGDAVPRSKRAPRKERHVVAGGWPSEARSRGPAGLAVCAGRPEAPLNGLRLAMCASGAQKRQAGRSGAAIGRTAAPTTEPWLADLCIGRTAAPTTQPWLADVCIGRTTAPTTAPCLADTCIWRTAAPTDKAQATSTGTAVLGPAVLPVTAPQRPFRPEHHRSEQRALTGRYQSTGPPPRVPERSPNRATRAHPSIPSL